MSNTVEVYSRGKFAQLSDNQLAGKAIIRLHNHADIGFYPDKFSGGLVFFFDDTQPVELSFIDKVKVSLQLMKMPLRYEMKDYHAKEMIDFIKKNNDKDFVIHCEYGKKRSVAVAVFLKNFYGYTITNKTQEEQNNYNEYVYKLLKDNN